MYKQLLEITIQRRKIRNRKDFQKKPWKKNEDTGDSQGNPPSFDSIYMNK